MADKKQTEINTQEPDAERSLTLLLKETEGNFDSLPDAKKEEIKKQYLSLYDKIQDIQESPDLAKVLELLSWSGSSPMGLSLMAALLETAEPELTEPLSIGNSLGLLYKQPGDSAGYGVHALPRTLCREKKPISDNKQWVEDVSQKLGQWFEARRKEYGQSDAFEQELLHLREWLTHITPISPYHSGRLTWLGAYESYHNGDYEESRQLVQKALSILEKSEKPAHKLNADMLIDLGYIYGELDNHAEALKSQQTAYDLLTAEVGEEHEDTADLLDSIAGIFDGLGKKDEAIAKYERALEIRKKIFGLQHPDTATSLNNVGMSYYESAQYGNAIEYLQQTLGLRTEILGADNTDTLGTLYNLTVCLVNLKRFKPAFDTLSKHLKDVPPDNPRYNELASLVSYIDSESIKSGFRAPSTQNASRGGGKKKKKKKKK